MDFGKNIYIYGTTVLNYKEHDALDNFIFNDFDKWLDSRRLTATIYINKNKFMADREMMELTMTICEWASIERNYRYRYRYERGKSYIRNYQCRYERAFSTDIIPYLCELINKCRFDNCWKEKYYIDTDIETINNIYGYKKEENKMPPKTYYDFVLSEPSQAVKDQSRHKMVQSMDMLLGIQNVKFQDPATIVFWDDGTKTVVKCQKGDKFDPEKGFAMAIVKKKVGRNEGYFNKIFQKWCPDEETLMIDFLDRTIAKEESKRPTVFTETAEEYKEEVKKLKMIGDGYDDIRWETK